MSTSKPLRVAFIHPDLGIGGAERLVVDAALGLQKLGHSVDIYTSYHDPKHCFEETIDGTLRVHHVKSLLPRAILGKLHILLAQLRQLQLTRHLVYSETEYDVFFVDQLSACVPLLRKYGQTRVVFYCHFPDKLLAQGAFVEGGRPQMSFLKRLYRLPMDLIEESTTNSADVLLANSNFTARIFRSYFPSIERKPKTVYPGINTVAYETSVDASDPDIAALNSDKATFLSINRFEKKKNVALAVKAFVLFRSATLKPALYRLVLAGGYDNRVSDNRETLKSLIELVTQAGLSFNVTSPSGSNSALPSFPKSKPHNPDVLFLLNFTTLQRTSLLAASSTRALLYTPTNEHFGIGPVEGMITGLPVLATNTGGPTETVISAPSTLRTGWLEDSEPEIWCRALQEIMALTPKEREQLAERAKERANRLFSMDAMTEGMDEAIREAYAMGSLRANENEGYVVSYTIMFIIFLLSCGASYYVTQPYVTPAGLVF